MLTIITNNHARPVVDAHELTEKERREFDYLNWEKIEAGEDSASFVRYKGELRDLGEFLAISNVTNVWPSFAKWHGYTSDSFFSGILVKYFEDNETVIMGRYFA